MPLPHTRTALVAMLAAAAIAMVTLAPSAVAAPRMAKSIDSAEIAQVRLINRFRATQNLVPLRIDGKLSRTAAWMGADLGSHGMFSHSDSMGRDPFQRLRAFGYPSVDTFRGENLAAGNAATVATYLQWLRSPGHKANMVNPRYRAIGIARVFVPGSPYGYYWVTEFGSKWTSAPA